MFDLKEYIRRHIEFSQKTFGPGQRTVGLTRHIEKECEEIRADPNDPKEWIDVIILAIDGAWRAGMSPEDISRGLEEKLAINMARKWPDWRTRADDQPIEHDRSADAYLGQVQEGSLK